jgi:hypothetical protein
LIAHSNITIYEIQSSTDQSNPLLEPSNLAIMSATATSFASFPMNLAPNNDVMAGHSDRAKAAQEKALKIMAEFEEENKRKAEEMSNHDDDTAPILMAPGRASSPKKKLGFWSKRQVFHIHDNIAEDLTCLSVDKVP